MLNGIYNDAINSEPFKGIITFKDVVDFSENIFVKTNKNKYDK